jgi:hypothetical protein
LRFSKNKNKQLASSSQFQPPEEREAQSTAIVEDSAIDSEKAIESHEKALAENIENITNYVDKICKWDVNASDIYIFPFSRNRQKTSIKPNHSRRNLYATECLSTDKKNIAFSWLQGSKFSFIKTTQAKYFSNSWREDTHCFFYV